LRLLPDWTAPYSLLAALYLQDQRVQAARQLLERRLPAEANELLAPLWDLFFADLENMPGRAEQYLKAVLKRHVTGTPSLSLERPSENKVRGPEAGARSSESGVRSPESKKVDAQAAAGHSPLSSLEQIARSVQRKPNLYTPGSVIWADLYLQYLRN